MTAVIHPEHSPTTDTSVKNAQAPIAKVDHHTHDHGSKSLATLALIFGVSSTFLALVSLVLVLARP